MNILTIGGSDPSSGAGIQSDIKTFANLDCYGFSVITALTSQNSSKYLQTESVSTKMISSQIDAIFSDFQIDGIKISMVFSMDIIKTIYHKLKDVKIPLVIDPVIESTTGGMLLEKNALPALKKLFRLADVITPNVKELEILSGQKITSKNDLKKAVSKLKEYDVKTIVTGYESSGDIIEDVIFDETNIHILKNKKISSQNHGSGCNYSSALIVAIARNENLLDAAKFAQRYTYNSIKNSIKIGKELDIVYNKSPNGELLKGIREFCDIKNIYKFIPQCQCNFVYAKDRSNGIKDILGVKGRMVKSGKEIIVAGEIEYGGSKHVATAVLEMQKKFPKICSAVNLKLDQKIIKNARKNKWHISQYDRNKEPAKIKEGYSTIQWGIKEAIKDSEIPPDLIYHKGDYGKEPMILIFGRNPKEVIGKILRVL